MEDKMTEAERLAKAYAKRIWKDNGRPYDSSKEYSRIDYLAGYKAATERAAIRGRVLEKVASKAKLACQELQAQGVSLPGEVDDLNDVLAELESVEEGK